MEVKISSKDRDGREEGTERLFIVFDRVVLSY